MGLERLLRGLYGTEPQIDLDRGFARVRVPRPTTFDFAKLADGVKRTNADLLFFQLEGDVSVSNGKVQVHPTGQVFALRGEAGKAGRGRRIMKVVDWSDPAATVVELID